MKSLGDLVSWLENAPEGTLVNARKFGALLAGLVDGETDGEGDLTLAEVGERVGRSPSTVRGWCAAGSLRGYRLNGKEWRVRPSELRAFLNRQRAEPKKKRAEAIEFNLGARRKDDAA